MRPLYAAVFFQGLVFWYVVDKLVATKVGLSATGIATILGVMSLLTIIAEIPTGILADRWSRKGVLIISAGFLAAATFFGSIATHPWHYLALSICWGIFFAMYSGTYEAMVYDTLIEEQGHADDFEKRFGRVGQFDGSALMIGSLGGGVLASSFGLHLPFYLTFVSIACSIVALMRFREPRVHKHVDQATKLIQHARQTFRAALHSPVLLALFLVSATLGATMRLGFEFNQLWYIKLGLPVALFGVFNSSVFLMLIVRSKLLEILPTGRFDLLVMVLLGGALASVGLSAKNPYLAATAVSIVMLFALSSGLIITGLQQQRFPSKVRAGAVSVISTVTHLTFIPVGYSFGVLVDRLGISRASWFVTILFLVSAMFALRARRAELTANRVQ